MRGLLKIAEYAPGIPSRRNIGEPTAGLKPGMIADFVLQQHDTVRKPGRPHLDLRIGTPATGMYSWALPKAHMPEPSEKVLAAATFVHAPAYNTFEGRIGKGYGAGTVTRKDLGKAVITKVSPNVVHFTLGHRRATPRYMLVHTKGKTGKDWLLIGQPQPGSVAGVGTKPVVKPLAAADLDDALEQAQQVQAKIDGASGIVDVDAAGNVDAYSVRPSAAGEPIRHTERMGLFGTQAPAYKGTTLRGEMYYTDAAGKAIPFKDVGGVLNQNIAKSLETQRARRYTPRIALFDVLKYQGKPVAELADDEKQKIVSEFAAKMQDAGTEVFTLPDSATDAGKRKLVEDIRAGRNRSTQEGVILLMPDGRRLKFKNREEATGYITGTYAGSGKREATAGGLTFNLGPGTSEGRVGSGLTDKELADIVANLRDYIGRPIRLGHQGQFASGKLRAPVFEGFEMNKTSAPRWRPPDVQAAMFRNDTRALRTFGQHGGYRKAQIAKAKERIQAALAEYRNYKQEQRVADPNRAHVLDWHEQDLAKDAMIKDAIIRRRGNSYVLYSHKGKVLGRHSSRVKALRQERAIQARKHASDGVIGVDLDGTLATYNGWKGVEHIGKPVAKMVARVRRWLNAGKDVRIFTARASSGPKAVKAVKDWCQEHLGRRLPVTNVKTPDIAKIYDDRAEKIEKNTGVKLSAAMDFPRNRQTYSYDCGACAVQSVLQYYGHDARADDVMKAAKTDKRGTTCAGIEAALKHYGLKFKSGIMAVSALKKHVEAGVPVILDIQAYAARGTTINADKSGHYVVVIGFKDGKFILEDPANVDRVSMTETELRKRWHDAAERVSRFQWAVAVFGTPKYKSTKVVPISEAEKTAYAPSAEEVALAAAKTDTNPTDEQKKAGNYKKGHINIRGLDIVIENPQGSYRSGKSKDGTVWRNLMHAHYGYVRRIAGDTAQKGNDGDHVDVFIGPSPKSYLVFVINQVDPKTGKFDEHKAVLGCKTPAEAKALYLSCYDKGWKGCGSIKAMVFPQFKKWVAEGDTTKKAQAAELAYLAAILDDVPRILAQWRRRKEDEDAAFLRADPTKVAQALPMALTGAMLGEILAARKQRDSALQYEAARRAAPRVGWLRDRVPKGVKLLRTPRQGERYIKKNRLSNELASELRQYLSPASAGGMYLGGSGKTPSAIVLSRGEARQVLKHEIGHAKIHKELQAQGRPYVQRQGLSTVLAPIVGARRTPLYRTEEAAWNRSGVPQGDGMRDAALATYEAELASPELVGRGAALGGGAGLLVRRLRPLLKAGAAMTPATLITKKYLPTRKLRTAVAAMFKHMRKPASPGTREMLGNVITDSTDKAFGNAAKYIRRNPAAVIPTVATSLIPGPATGLIGLGAYAGTRRLASAIAKRLETLKPSTRLGATAEKLHTPIIHKQSEACDTAELQFIGKAGAVKATLTAEIADTLTKRAQGLMGRDELDDTHGMFFDKVGAYWMKDVKIPLDILFLDKQGQVLDIQHMPLDPLGEKLYTPKDASAAHAIETPAGWSHRMGVRVGDHVVAR